MKLRVVSSKNDIVNLNSKEKMIHIAFRASNVDFLNLIQKCPSLRIIQIPPSYWKPMSNAIPAFLDMQGIELIEGDVWGHKKNLDEYFNIEETLIQEIKNLASSGMSMKDIVSRTHEIARISPQLIEYIAKFKVYS